jgi:circadian clock protein KaiC
MRLVVTTPLRPSEDRTASTGIPGLDDILAGGFTTRRLYLIEGEPGTGKTTLALQFLFEGTRQGEPALIVALAETKEELQAIARSHGWSLDGIHIQELPANGSGPDRQYTVFHPGEIELVGTVRQIFSAVDATQAKRVVIDSLSELRLLAESPLRYRRQIIALKQFFATRDCTVLLLDDCSTLENDLQLHSLAHAVVRLEQLHPEFGAERRRLRVTKYRGVRFRGGNHDFNIRPGGLQVYPRLVAAEHRCVVDRELIRSGLPALDQALGGGLERGSSTLIVGAAGCGKSSFATQFVAGAVAAGLRAAMFVFDESVSTLLTRASGLGVDLEGLVRDGRVRVRQVDPAEMSSGELVHTIRQSVDLEDAAVVVIDSLNGYLNAMPEEHYLTIQLHELLMYLGQRGVATIMVGVHHGLIGSHMTMPVDASYLADTVLLLRYFELDGDVRQAFSVAKRRGGEHERTIREFRLRNGGIHIGEPLRGFRGVLTGVPVREPAPPPGLVP